MAPAPPPGVGQEGGDYLVNGRAGAARDLRCG